MRPFDYTIRNLLSVGSLLAATAMADYQPLTEISLFTGPDETSIDITASKEGLQLGQTRLEPWPYAMPACDGCNLAFERSFSPVGPDRTVLLTVPEATQPTWFFAERLRLPASLPGGVTLRATRGAGLALDAGTNPVSLSPGETARLNDCEYHLIWHEHLRSGDTSSNEALSTAPGTAANPQPEIVAEDPSVKVQIQGNCY